ncbi:hypothetical protein MJO28_001062 [Puccinia striiformis f. sp. tritici]|uniref:Retrotransposon Copia-like N-terminal domain-containing protein n=3 Tax=Puccinia striiformis TaxID=27350 RepID=A0A0L0V354_9BASI|nr:hypothetical protein Pst134EA_033215 [Puccinia striiformis f. sp. tritici]KNE93712.1 hypothetical protein PSTG_12901 [Puccinia striiformis f. sp. tritici PST-78]POW17348.1 hypothetical protein PSTT_00754 [Puccinia striiformis]KAH9466327.1 hypothetical protein Pst134EB_033235 [Puccinia striiformis f. sp. tritici]KAH9473113.1 hypothetical protein Pst134EA_033215 [Puccinia striiformis f. sp. tritici]KAI7962968.1 hypothetical protein MJO28_001062 [Puccinia striiformis f. sp. tritici]
MLLDATNYTSWKAYIEQRLQDEGLLGITLGDELMPDDQQQEGTNSKEIMEEFKKKSRTAFYLLIKSIDDSVIFSVSAHDFENNPRELWTTLKAKYLPDDLSAKLEAMRNLRSVKYKNDPDQFIEQIRDRFAKIEHAGFEFDETTWMVFFLSQLPRTLTDLMINPSSDTNQSTTTHKSSISTCDQLFEKLKSCSINYPPAQNNNKQPTAEKSNNHQPTPSPGTGPNHLLSCTKCNKKGHDLDHCWFAHPERNPFFKANNHNQQDNQSSNSNNNSKFKKVDKAQSSSTTTGWIPATTYNKKFHHNGKQPDGSNNTATGPNNNTYNHQTKHKNYNNNNNQDIRNGNYSNNNNNAENNGGGGGSEWTSFSKKPFKANSDSQNDWRAPATKQMNKEENQAGSNEGASAKNIGTPSNNKSGWNDQDPKPTTSFNTETGWTDNVHDF